jgi:hypothetical protein
VSENEAIRSSSLLGGWLLVLGAGVGKGRGNKGCCSSGCTGNLELELCDEWLEYL